MVEVAAFNDASDVVVFNSGDKNMVRVTHPGDRTSILDAVQDNSGNGRGSADANVVRSELTGERIGSVSGKFHDVLDPVPSAPAFASNRSIFEHNGAYILAIRTNADAGSQAGLQHHVGLTGRRGEIVYVLGASEASDYWCDPHR